YKATPIGEADDTAIDDEKPGDSQVDLEEIAKLIEIMESAKKTMVTMLVINCAAFAIFAAIGVVVIIKQYHK
ncbi:MAG: hypothetical protein J6Q55_02780, partial [Clostridia bacterium]|nr:hypothetical protein [Clostridia bacterium]